jgi:acyl dehydratase
MLGRFLEELEPGYLVQLGTYVFTDANIAAYIAKYAPVPFHLNASDAAAGLMGRKVAAGFHVCSGWMACFVAGNTAARASREAGGLVLPEIGPSPGLEDIAWPTPVYPGDVISYATEVTAKRVLKSRPYWGLVTARCSGRKQDGTLVVSFVSKILVARQR